MSDTTRYFDMDKMYAITGREFLALLSLIPDGDESAKAVLESVADREASEKNGSWGAGYCPHASMERFKCPRCGSVHFKSYPQTVPADRSKTWTYEYVCAKCGQGMGLTRVGDE